MKESYENRKWESTLTLLDPKRDWSRPVSPAITEHLCKTVVAHEERAKSLKDLIRAAMENPSPYLPESPMTPAERAAFTWGFTEGMNVVLEYIKSGQPGPR